MLQRELEARNAIILRTVDAINSTRDQYSRLEEKLNKLEASFNDLKASLPSRPYSVPAVTKTPTVMSEVLEIPTLPQPSPPSDSSVLVRGVQPSSTAADPLPYTETAIDKIRKATKIRKQAKLSSTTSSVRPVASKPAAPTVGTTTFDNVLKTNTEALLRLTGNQ